MPSNIYEFTADLEKFAKAKDIEFGKLIRRTVLEIDRKIVFRTPVDTGRARASWAVHIGGPSDFVQPDGFKGSPEIAASIATNQALVAIQSLERNPFRDVWITSNVEYIVSLEGGHSMQAPAGMVAITLAEVEAGFI